MRAALLAVVISACGYPPLDLGTDAHPRPDGHGGDDAHTSDGARPDAIDHLDALACPIHVAYTGPVMPIPDNSPGGVSIPLDVFNVGTLSKVVFHIDGATCTTDAGATTVGIDHTFVGDLTLTLTSPQGTTVTLLSAIGASGHNFCQTVLDDAAAAPIQLVDSSQAPFIGAFSPDLSLAAFTGEDGAGTWVLNASDAAAADTGSVRAFSIDLTASGCN